MNLAEATRLQDAIIRGIQELESNLTKFIDGQGWVPLGFMSFLEWWDTKIVSMRLGSAIRAVVVSELSAPDPITYRTLTDREIATRLGVGKDTVRRDSGRKKPLSRRTGKDDNERVHDDIFLEKWKTRAMKALQDHWGYPAKVDVYRHAVDEYLRKYHHIWDDIIQEGTWE